MQIRESELAQQSNFELAFLFFDNPVIASIKGEGSANLRDGAADPSRGESRPDYRLVTSSRTDAANGSVDTALIPSLKRSVAVPSRSVCGLGSVVRSRSVALPTGTSEVIGGSLPRLIYRGSVVLRSVSRLRSIVRGSVIARSVPTIPIATPGATLSTSGSGTNRDREQYSEQETQHSSTLQKE